MTKIIPKRTIYFEELENGAINQLLGENYWALRDDGKNAYFDTLEEARKFINEHISTSKTKGVKNSK